MTNLPMRLDKADAIALRTRKLMLDAERIAARHDVDLIDFARQILAGRKQRNRYFDPLLFGNPAWDILLTLFVADDDRQDADFGNELVGPGVPPGVVRRWLRYLEGAGMVTRGDDADRPQRSRLQLTEMTRATVRNYLGTLVSLGLGSELAMPDIPPAAD